MKTTVSPDLVLLDTSVWIDYFRKKKAVFGAVESLIDEERVCTLNFIVAELLQGARSDSEFHVLKAATEVFFLLEEKPDTWIEAARLSNQLRRQGQSVGLGDCYIATMVHQNNAKIWSLDKHFKKIQKYSKIRFYSP